MKTQMKSDALLDAFESFQMSKNDIEKLKGGDDGCARWKVRNNTMILTASMCEDGSIVYRNVMGQVVTEEFIVNRNDHFFNP